MSHVARAAAARKPVAAIECRLADAVTLTPLPAKSLTAPELSSLPWRRYQDRVDLGFEFSQTLMKKLAEAVTPLGATPPESFGDKLVYIMGNTTCEPKPGNVRFLNEDGTIPEIAQDRLQIKPG